jgi:hypothetical protein
MPKRKTVADIEKKWLSGGGEAVAFIPDLRIMGLSTAAECIDMLRRDWGLKSEVPAVCLPLVGVDGVSFQNNLCASRTINAKVSDTAATPKTLGQIARDFADLGCDIYLYVVPSLQFLQVENCHKVDIRGKGTPEACVHRSKTQEFLNYLIGAGIDHVQEHLRDANALIGVVLDITDLWGMGGSSGKIYMTCFCDECRQYFAAKKLPLAQFETHPNPWELLLTSTETGVSYIDNLSYGETPASLVGKSSLQGFGQSFRTDGERTHAAELVMQYMIARHEMVEDFLAAVYQEARVVIGEEERQLKKVVLVEGVDYDWTAGVFPGRISPPVIDEIWVDPTDQLPPLSSPNKMFMWRRSSYFLNAFFQFLSDVGDARIRTTTGLALISEGTARDRLRERGAKAINNELRGTPQLASMSPLEDGRRDGFVGIVFSNELLRSLIASAYVAPGLIDTEQNEQARGQQEMLARMMSRMTDASSKEGEEEK